MKFGANTFIWESPFSTKEHLYLVEKVKSMGFDLIEAAVEDPKLVELAPLKDALQSNGLGVVMCGAFGPGRNLSSLEASERQAAENYLKWMIEAAAELGSPVVCGPMYSAVGKPRLEKPEDRQKEYELAVEGLKRMCAFAGDRGVRLAFEPLNRFETDLINIVDQGLDLIEAVGSPYLGFHLDTFHMHLEEKNSAAAMKKAGERIFHFHACENDRGVPGTGQVRWDEIGTSLIETGYKGAVVIESFTPGVKSIARAVCIWREIAPDQDTLAGEGLAFLKKLLGERMKQEAVQP
jgi:D-psicose/D-tagatose/L-ribulose 3-epimerase